MTEGALNKIHDLKDFSESLKKSAFKENMEAVLTEAREEEKFRVKAEIREKAEKLGLSHSQILELLS